MFWYIVGLRMIGEEIRLRRYSAMERLIEKLIGPKEVSRYWNVKSGNTGDLMTDGEFEAWWEKTHGA